MCVYVRSLLTGPLTQDASFWCRYVSLNPLPVTVDPRWSCGLATALQEYPGTYERLIFSAFGTPSTSPSASVSPSTSPSPSVTPPNTPSPSVTPSNTETPGLFYAPYGVQLDVPVGNVYGWEVCFEVRRRRMSS